LLFNTIIDGLFDELSPKIYPCHMSMYDRLFKMIQSRLLPGAIYSPRATALHLAGNPYPSSALLDQAVESGSITLEPLSISSAMRYDLPSKGAGRDEV